MPEYVASIEVYFDAPTLEDAAHFADACADSTYLVDHAEVHVSAVTSGAALDEPKAAA